MKAVDVEDVFHGKISYGQLGENKRLGKRSAATFSEPFAVLCEQSFFT